MSVERIWLKNYPQGVPADIDMSEYQSLKDVVEQSCQKFRSLPAYSCMGKVLDYARLEELSRAFGVWLQNDAGLQKGDRVAVMMPNVLQYPVAVFGALRAGMVVVNVNPMYTPRELEHQLSDSGAKVIVIVENFASTLAKVMDKVPLEKVVTTQIGDLLGFPKSAITNFAIKRVKKMIPPWSLPNTTTFSDAIKSGAGKALADVSLTHDDLAF